MNRADSKFDRCLFELAAICNRSFDGHEPEEWPPLLDRIAELSGTDTCQVIICSSRQHLPSIAHQWAEKEHKPESRVLNTSRDTFPWLFPELKKHSQVCVSDWIDIPKDAALERRDFDRQGIGSFVATELRYHGSLIGFILAHSEASTPVWAEDDLLFLTECADLIANYLGRTRAEHNLISKVVELEERVDKTEARYGSILESLAEGLVIADKDGHLTYCNSRFCEITAFSKNEILGRRVYEVFFQNAKRDMSKEIEVMHERYQQRMKGRAEEYELEITRRDGEVRWLEVRAAPLRDTTGQIVGSIGMNIDITERKQLETQLRWSQKMEAVGRLAGGVAHDFNNLLTVISGYASMLLSHMDKEDPNLKRVQAIGDASEAASSLTQQLLTVSRRQVVQPKVLQLNDAIEHMIGIIQGLIGENIRLETDLAEDLPFVEVDPGQLQQIIMNLAVNAKDAMPSGGRLRIVTSNVMHDGNNTASDYPLKVGEYLVLTMSDTGDGMSEETRAHLFEPFFTTKKGGTGLGLSTVYGIIKQHGGRISVASKLGEGSEFSVYFKPAKEGATLEEASAELKVGTGNETILVVEDEVAVRELVRYSLEQKGYQVIEARHGGEALELLAASERRIDLILTDIVMPHVNGFELYEKIIAQQPDMKILMMSGCTHDSTIPKNILKYGIPFLPKPFGPDVLADKVRTALDGSKGSSSKQGAIQ